jgi:hypothetical protein
MTIQAMSITDPDQGITLPLVPSDDVNVADWDVAATPREVSYPNPGQDGRRDNTLYLDAAAVTMELALKSNIGAQLDVLSALNHPSRRPFLVIDDDEYPGGPRQIRLRFASKTGPYEADNYRLLQLGWTAPGGLWEDQVPSQATVGGSASTGGGLAVGHAGLAIGHAGLAIGSSASGSSLMVTGGGAVRRPFTARLYGPCSGPKLTNDVLTIPGRPNGNIVFPDSVSVAAGDYVEVNTGAKTALRNSDPAQSVPLDWANSDWWLMEPGQNLIRYHPATTSGPVAAVLTWTPARTP